MDWRYMYMILRRPAVMLAVVLLGILLTYYSLFRNSSEEHPSNNHLPSFHPHNSHSLTMNDLSSRWSFRPVFIDGSGKIPPNTAPRIPRILHQVWDTKMIPLRFEPWIRTWKVINPDWEYWFWTLEAVDKLIAEHFSQYLVLFRSYEGPIYRADVMRYFVLYKYGGVYMDLDMECMKPLDNWTMHYDCIVSEENYEHAFIVQENPVTNIVNGIMACRTNHPLMLKTIESLNKAAHRFFGDFLRATGPLFFNYVFNQYKTTASDVTVVPPVYFLPTYDDSESDTISGKCAPGKFRSLPEKSQFMCRELLKTGFRNEVSPRAYTNHHWVHSYMYDPAWKTRDLISIKDIVPSVIYGESKI